MPATIDRSGTACVRRQRMSDSTTVSNQPPSAMPRARPARPMVPTAATETTTFTTTEQMAMDTGVRVSWAL